MNNIDPRKNNILSEGENYDKDGRTVNTENPDHEEPGADSSIKDDKTPLPEQEKTGNEDAAEQHEEFIDEQNDEEV